jgi:putative Holliday junction resolvase
LKCEIILSLDYGEKKVGLALKPLGSLEIKEMGNFKNEGDLLLKVVNFCKEHKVTFVILGYPLSAHYRKNKTTFIVERFAKILRNSLSKKVRLKLVSERYTTAMAKIQYFSKHHSHYLWNKKKDTMAAKIILERFLQREYDETR